MSLGDISMLRTELEALTGKLIRGDLTPIVYELIKESPFKLDILEYSSIPKERIEDATKKRISGHANFDSCAGPNFEDWFSNEAQPITLSRNASHSHGEDLPWDN